MLCGGDVISMCVVKKILFLVSATRGSLLPFASPLTPFSCGKKEALLFSPSSFLSKFPAHSVLNLVALKSSLCVPAHLKLCSLALIDVFAAKWRL